MSLWGGILFLLKLFIPSFMRRPSKLDEKSSKWGCIQDSEETTHVSNSTEKDLSRSASRYLHASDSAYDTLHTRFSPNRSVEQGYKSDLSDQETIDNLSYPHRLSKCIADNVQDTRFSPVNKQNVDFSDHVTYSTRQKSRRNESMENCTDVKFRDSRDVEQQNFAAFPSENKSMRPEYGSDRDCEMKLNFHNMSDFSDLPKSGKRFRKQKEPDVYNGESVEWPDYLCHFEQVSRWNEWTDCEKATQLAMCLRGRAQRVLSELTSRELNDYFELKSALTQRFCPAEREAAYRCDFRNRRRKFGESVADYGYTLRRLASRAFSSFPLDMRESLTVEQFVSGLGSQELKRYVQFSHPKSLDRAISLALEFESFEGSQDTLRKPRDTEKLPQRQCNALISPDKNDSSNHANNEGLENTIERIVQKTLSSMYVDQKPDSQPKRYMGSRNVKCFTCKQSGHISRNCPHNQNLETQGTSQSGNGSKNDISHLNENGLCSRPQAQPHKSQ